MKRTAHSSGPAAARNCVLFVCSRNQWRSPTAEQLFRRHQSLDVRSAGTSPRARRRINADDVRWADTIIVMESKHKQRIRAQFGSLLVGKTLHVLDIPDEYRYMDPELVALLELSVTALLSLDRA